MTLPHHNATATITIDGLAVCCYNKGQNKWEVGFLHPPASEPQHALILKIDDEGPIQIPDTTAQITFNATNPQMPNFPGSAKGFFDPFGQPPARDSFPTTADQLEDFRCGKDNVLSGRVDCDITWLGASNNLDAIIPA